ncbi:hypothetical protein VIBNISFn118_370015 [Vibrio nigripulchritudo SFn118]|nr:hypothetical protein VIBNISFn118_370015 [Vibrio nigripulchritudo SFn118]
MKIFLKHHMNVVLFFCHVRQDNASQRLKHINPTNTNPYRAHIFLVKNRNKYRINKQNSKSGSNLNQ